MVLSITAFCSEGKRGLLFQANENKLKTLNTHQLFTSAIWSLSFFFINLFPEDPSGQITVTHYLQCCTAVHSMCIFWELQWNMSKKHRLESGLELQFELCKNGYSRSSSPLSYTRAAFQQRTENPWGLPSIFRLFIQPRMIGGGGVVERLKLSVRKLWQTACVQLTGAISLTEG